MPPTCSICRHPSKDAIERLLLGRAPLRDVAQQHATTPWSLLRHRDHHLPAHLAQARDAADAASGDDLLASLMRLSEDAHRIKDTAERAGDLTTALRAIRELVHIIEVLAELRGELDRRPVAIITSPEWVALRGLIMTALWSYPEARAAVAAAIMAHNGDHGERDGIAQLPGP